VRKHRKRISRAVGIPFFKIVAGLSHRIGDVGTPTTPEPDSGKLSSDKFLWAATNDLVETPFPASDVITMRCIERPTYFVALKIKFRFLSHGLEGTRSTRAMSFVRN